MVYEEKSKVYEKWRIFGSGATKEENANPDTKTKVDAALLHDIAPQPGDDHEPLNGTGTLHSRSMFSKIATLKSYGDREE